MNIKTYIDRDIEPVLKKIVGQFPAVALTGPRQSGKSTLLKHIFKDTHSFISLDDPLIREQAITDPKLILDRSGKNVIIDEIQYAPQILSYIKILIDSDRNACGRFILTGSQQFSLIKNLGDTLAGRIALLNLLPFSVKEMDRIPGLGKKLKNVSELFIFSSLRGSFPEIAIRGDIDSKTWYGSYIQTYLERDIRTIYDIGILREFQQFMRLLASRCSQILNLSSFASDIGVSVNTIKKWISVLEASRIIYTLPPYYKSSGKRITKAPKIYFLDTGLVCYLNGINTPEQILSGPFSGALFENFIIQETVKSFFNRGVVMDLYYIRTHNDIEVDLILDKNGTIYPVEIKLTKTPGTGMARQIERFKALFTNFKIAEGKLVCLSEDNCSLTKNVSVVTADSYFEFLNTL